MPDSDFTLSAVAQVRFKGFPGYACLSRPDADAICPSPPGMENQRRPETRNASAAAMPVEMSMTNPTVRERMFTA